MTKLFLTAFITMSVAFGASLSLIPEHSCTEQVTDAYQGGYIKGMRETTDLFRVSME